jgi:hypothetical protein
MNPYGDIDLTRYLQTEGRRRAAALAAARKDRNAPPVRTDAQQQCGAAPAQQQQQQQCDAPKPATSLREVLVQMGVA